METVTIVGKLLDGRFVEILRFAKQVQFSDQKDWLLIDPEIGRKKCANLRWVPASTTHFEWVRPFRFK